MGIIWAQDVRDSVYEEMAQMDAISPTRIKNQKLVFKDSIGINRLFRNAQSKAGIKSDDVDFRESLSTKELEELLPKFCVAFFGERKQNLVMCGKMCGNWVTAFLEDYFKLNPKVNKVTQVTQSVHVDSEFDLEFVNAMNSQILSIGQKIAELGVEVSGLSEQLDKLRSKITNTQVDSVQTAPITHVVLFDSDALCESVNGNTKVIKVKTYQEIAKIKSDYPALDRVTIALSYTSKIMLSSIQNVFGNDTNINLVRLIGGIERLKSL